MTGEIDLFGVFVPALLVHSVLAVIIVNLLRRLPRWPLRDSETHRQIFDLSMVIIITALSVFLL